MVLNAQKIATVTNLCVLGSIGLVASSLLQTKTPFKATLFFIGGLLIIFSSFIEFATEDPDIVNRRIEASALGVGMFLYAIAALAALLSHFGIS